MQNAAKKLLIVNPTRNDSLQDCGSLQDLEGRLVKFQYFDILLK